MTPRVVLVVFASLIGLTALTVAASQFELGVWHGPVGLGIAGIKAALIAVFFMHVARSSRLTWVIALSGIFWLCLLLGFTMTDVLTRSWAMQNLR